MPPVTMYPPSEVGKESKPKAASLFVELESRRALMNVVAPGGGGGGGFAAATAAAGLAAGPLSAAEAGDDAARTAASIPPIARMGNFRVFRTGIPPIGTPGPASPGIPQFEISRIIRSRASPGLPGYLTPRWCCYWHSEANASTEAGSSCGRPNQAQERGCTLTLSIAATKATGA